MPLYKTPFGFFHSADEPEQGQEYPPAVLAWISEQEKIQLRKYVNTKRDQAKARGFLWEKAPGQWCRVETHARAREDLAGERAAALDGVRNDGEIWRMGDNTDVALTNAELLAMAMAARNHCKECYGVSWQLKAEIEAGTITTAEEIDAAAWPGGW